MHSADGGSSLVRFAVRDVSWAAQGGAISTDSISGASGILLAVNEEDDPADIHGRLASLCTSLPEPEFSTGKLHLLQTMTRHPK